MKIVCLANLKNKLISNFMKICQVRAELFHAEGRSDGQADRHGESKLSLSQNIATDIPTAY